MLLIIPNLHYNLTTTKLIILQLLELHPQTPTLEVYLHIQTPQKIQDQLCSQPVTQWYK